MPISSDIESQRSKVADIPVCIVIPPSTFLAEERVMPILGPLKVAGELKRNGNLVDVLDLSGYRNYSDIVDDYARSSGVKTFGITATTPQLPAAAQIISHIREAVPEAKVILGGTHATLTHSSMEQDKALNRQARGTQNYEQIDKLADTIVVGDGEKAIFYAIDPDNNQKVIGTGRNNDPLFLQENELERFSWPARECIDLDTYRYDIDGHRATTMIVQLGCPMGCRFCSGRSINFLRQTRTRSVENATAEMEFIYNTYGYTGFMFYDDELNIVPGALEQLCRGSMMLQEKYGVSFALRGFVKAERFTMEQARLMKAAGFSILLTGVESGSDQILDAIRKNTTPDINTQCRDFAGAAGLKFKALMSIGHPGESSETVQQSIDWALKVEPEDIDWTTITPYPGAPYYDDAVFDPDRGAWLFKARLTRGSLKGEVVKLWSDSVDYIHEADYYKGVPGEYKAHVFTEYLDRDELVKLRNAAEEQTRNKLQLPPITRIDQLQYEHSMGQGLRLPPSILRSFATVAT